MSVEIERKFLVVSPPWQPDVTRCQLIEQGYLNIDPRSTVRIRTAAEGKHLSAFITIKGKALGLVRSEFEYPIPHDDAIEMIRSMCLVKLAKRRWFVRHGDHEWHVDEFMGENQGLVVAEIELGHELETFDRPSWIGDEVTDDHRYANANLAVNPHRFW